MTKTVLLSLSLVAALAGGCKKKKEPAPKPGSDTMATGSGTGAGTGAMATGSGSGSAEAPKPDPKLVARGEYLAKLLGCPFCHMPMGPKGPDFTRPFAGGMEVPEKFGTWRAPNITPHKGTGIGTWTEEQIITAIREGKRPDGSKLFPIMPYPNYHRMTDDDAKAIAAFVMSLPAIDNAVAPNKDLKLPQLDLPKPANAPDPVDDPVKHGEYLVTLMHCNMCHATPDAKGMPDFQNKPFSGGMEFELPMLGTGKLYASNITSDPETGIGKWTEEQIASAIKTLTRPDGTIIQGPMQFYLAGWSVMDEKDLKAIAAYVKQIPAMKNKVPKSTFKATVSMGQPPAAGSGSAGSGSAGSGSAK